SIFLGRSFWGALRVRGPCELFGPWPRQPEPWHFAHSSRRVPSPLRFVAPASPEAWPHSRRVVLESRAFFPEHACPLMLTAVQPAVGPKRLQPMPVNNL